MPTSRHDLASLARRMAHRLDGLPRGARSAALAAMIAGPGPAAAGGTDATATADAARSADVSSMTSATADAPAVTVETPTVPAAAFERSTAVFADTVVLPAHEALVAATADLREAAAAFERAPDAASLATFRASWRRGVIAVAAGRAFAFGPVHSLGLDVAFDFPIDAAGIARTVDEFAGADVPTLAAERLTPSLTGLGAIDHLLGASEDPDDFAPPTRRYLHALARRIDASAGQLLDAWTNGHSAHPAFATALATAGSADNRAYRSVASGAEEIARGLIGTLDVVAHEELPATIEARGTLATAAGAVTLAALEATVGGVSAAYRGAGIERWFERDDRTSDATVRRSLDEASAAFAAASGDADDPVLAGAALARASASLERARATLETNALPRTRLPLAASAGEATSFDHTSSAYEAAPPNLGAKGIADHDLGDEAFEESFVLAADGVDHPNAGLGPTFNNTSCVGCHVRNGRGMPVPGQLLLRVSDARPGGEGALAHESDTLTVRGGTPPVKGLGNQIQDFGVAGVAPEARVDIAWRETTGAYPDGTPYGLRSPVFEVVLASTGAALPASVDVSPRVPPHVYGLGLLEAVPEADILALADPDDRDGDGISGRPNRVWNEALDDYSLGRFGWKANSPTLLQQTADAYLNDMGVHSPLFPAEDGSVEIDAATLQAATAYSQTLAVPARRSPDAPDVRRGEALFADSGCTGCHVETFETGAHEYPALVGQVIHPYTDLLLHDMGDGLADGRPDFEATGREWRTPSLWGVGLAQTVLPYSGYLHDGRARTLEEAILWHGGEAARAKSSFEHLPAADRDALVSFLRSL